MGSSWAVDSSMTSASEPFASARDGYAQALATLQPERRASGWCALESLLVRDRGLGAEGQLFQGGRRIHSKVLGHESRASRTLAHVGAVRSFAEMWARFSASMRSGQAIAKVASRGVTYTPLMAGVHSCEKQ